MTRVRVYLRLATVATVAALLGIVACSPQPPAKPVVKNASQRQKAPEFALKDASGKLVHLSDYKGKVVVLDFWATWCGPCKVEIPWFMEFEKEYRSKGFEVLGVSMDDDGWKAINPYVAEKKINYPIVLANEEVNEAYGGIEALPTTLIIGRDGRIRFIHSGLIARADYEKEIRELL